MLALTVQHGGAHGGGQTVEGVADGQDQRVVDGVAFLGAREADDGNLLLLSPKFNMEVWVRVCHGAGLF